MIIGIFPSVIHVVTSTGTDWAAISAAIATAVAAIIGVGGTAWQGAKARNAASEDVRRNLEAASADQKLSLEASAENLRQSLATSSEDLRRTLDATAQNLVTSINAEDRRAELAAKRRIYAACLASLKAMIPAVIMHRGETLRATSVDERLAARSRMHEQRAQMLNGVSEMRLIAPAEIIALADQAELYFMTYVNDTNNGSALTVEPPTAPVVIDRMAKLMRRDLGVVD